jgi:acyl carrier protein
VRGFRVELGEIEAMLGRHPEVREAVVLALEPTPGDKRLVAYLVSNQEFGLESGALRSYLRNNVPDYMVPSAFVTLKALPLTSSGKVDRQALAAKATTHPQDDKGYVAPRTPVEEELARLCAELLGKERVGINDNFFELGGHSLLATRLISRVRNAFEIELPLRTLFESPTVAGLALAIAQHQADQADSQQMTQLLAGLDQLSEQEARKMLADMEWSP